VASYLYGLIPRADAARLPPTATGIDGASVRAVACDALAALVSTVARVPSRERFDDIRAHDAVLREVMAKDITVAASRFGQMFASDDEICGELSTSAQAMAAHLDRCAGCVEMRLLLAEALPEKPATEAPTAPSTDVSPGRAYLEAVRTRVQGESRVGVKAALGPVVRSERVEGNDKSTTFAHLIRREDEDEYRAAVAAFPALVAARIVGPLPLYSFAEP
jgi:hypothetical protein